MAGLINIYTKSPFDYQGTKIKAGYGNHNTWNAALSHSHKINEYVAFSVSGKYRKNDGYFKNIATGKNSGSTEVAGGRAQIYIKILLPIVNITIRMVILTKCSTKKKTSDIRSIITTALPMTGNYRPAVFYYNIYMTGTL